MIDKIILYVELNGKIWMVMADGSWLPLSDLSLVDYDLPLLTKIEEIIQTQSTGELAFIYNGQTFVVDQQATQYVPAINNPNPSIAEENTTISSGSGLGATTRIQTDGNEVLAEAGFETRDSMPETTVLEESSSQLVGQLDDQAQVTINIDDGDDSVLNQYEAPLSTIYGTSSELEDGQIAVINVIDNQGKQLQFTATINNNSWSLGQVDLSSLNDGPINLEVVVADRYGNYVDAFTDSNIDSLASLDIQFENEVSDGFINRFEESNEGLSGIVNDVENGQVITIVVSDSNLKQETYSTTVIDGKWSIKNNDFSLFAEGKLTAVASVTDSVGNIATSTTTIIKDTIAQITLTLESGEDDWLNIDEIKNASLTGTVSGVEDGQIVTIVAVDNIGTIKTITTEVEDGKYAFSGLNLTGINDGTLSVTATVQDKAGNPTSTLNYIEVDTQARIVTHIESNGDNLLNAAEIGATRIWGITIEVDDSELVTLTVTDINGDSLVFTTTATNNAYSITEDLSSLAEGKLVVTAEVTDNAGNYATTTDDAIKDTVASITLTIADGGDGWLNQTEVESATISGNAIGIEDEQVVTITLTDNDGETKDLSATVSDGKFIVSDVDISNFSEGEFSAVASVSDVAGNPADANDTALIDTLASLSLNIDSGGDGVVNAVEVSNTRLFGNAADVQNGAKVNIVITDSDGKTLSFEATVNNNKYSIVGNLSALSEGRLEALATVVDQYDNVAIADANVEKDTLADITVSVESGGDGYLNEFEVGSVSGEGIATNIEDGNRVLITATDGAGNVATTDAFISGGQYDFDGLDLSGFVEGGFTVVATVSDDAGNPTIAEVTLQVDTLATITVVVESGTDNVLNSSEVVKTEFHGETTGVENDAIVAVSVTDSAGKTIVFTTTVLNNKYQIDDAGLSSLAEGDLTVSAFVTDEHGNEAEESTTVLKDTLASITVDIKTDGDLVDTTINLVESTQTEISGTAINVNNGRVITVVVSDGNNNSLTFTTTVMSESWILPSVNLSSLDDGVNNITAVASVSDLAGNPATATDSVSKDTLAAITVSIESGSDNSLNAAEILAGTDIVGSVTNIEDGKIVDLVISDQDGKQVTRTATIKAGGGI